MRRSIWRLSAAMLAMAAAGMPVAAMDAGCPSHLTGPGGVVCHNTEGTSCSSCTYNCGSYGTHTWDVCGLIEG